jgi:hypothetical protein
MYRHGDPVRTTHLSPFSSSRRSCSRWGRLLARAPGTGPRRPTLCRKRRLGRAFCSACPNATAYESEFITRSSVSYGLVLTRSHLINTNRATQEATHSDRSGLKRREIVAYSCRRIAKSSSQTIYEIGSSHPLPVHGELLPGSICIRDASLSCSGTCQISSEPGCRSC